MKNFYKLKIVFPFLLFLTLVLMLLPYSVPEKAMLWTGEETTDIVIKTYAYFSPQSLSYGGFVPFISAIACVVTIVLFFILLSKKRKKIINLFFFLAIAISLAASAATLLIYKTLC